MTSRICPRLLVSIREGRLRFLLVTDVRGGVGLQEEVVFVAPGGSSTQGKVPLTTW